MSHVVDAGSSTASVEHLFEVWEITQDPQTDFDTKATELFELETEAFDLPYAFVSKIDRERNTQTIELAAGAHEELQPGERCPLSESYCRKTIRTADGVFHVDDAAAEGWEDDPAYERFGLGTYVGARVEVGEELFGTLCFASTDPREDPVTATERELVRLFAMWAGNQLRSETASTWGTETHHSAQVDELVRTVSHDLRSPLTVAEGRVELLESSVTDSLDQIRSAHRRMESIIEQLLLLARVDQPVVDSPSVDLFVCAGEAWEMVPTGDARLERTFESASVAADPDRLKNLLENLFRNSVEHGSTNRQSPADDRPGVTVEVGLTDRGFYVADDGPGIPPAERSAVFTPGHSGSTNGTGFGLSIVERIAAAHGWDVTLTDSEHGGARFEFSGVEFVPTDG